MKEVAFSNKKGTCERLKYFQIFLGSKMMYELSIMMNLKIIKGSSLQFLTFGTLNIYAAIGSEILRFVRTTSNLINPAACVDTNEKTK